jgi:hypothetical protein
VIGLGMAALGVLAIVINHPGRNAAQEPDGRTNGARRAG